MMGQVGCGAKGYMSHDGCGILNGGGEGSDAKTPFAKHCLNWQRIRKTKGRLAAALKLKLEKHSGSHPTSVLRSSCLLSTPIINFAKTLGIGPGETRTHILEGANLALYPVELRGQRWSRPTTEPEFRT
jgi:hypothetical protein